MGVSLRLSFIALIVDSAVYFLIAAYLEQLNPGEYGVPKPFYFPFLPRFWCDIWDLFPSCHSLRNCCNRCKKNGHRVDTSDDRHLLGDSTFSSVPLPCTDLNLQPTQSEDELTKYSNAHPICNPTPDHSSAVRICSTSRGNMIEICSVDDPSMGDHMTEEQRVCMLPEILHSIVRLPNGQVIYEAENPDIDKGVVVIETVGLSKKFTRRSIWSCACAAESYNAVKESSFQVGIHLTNDVLR